MTDLQVAGADRSSTAKCSSLFVVVVGGGLALRCCNQPGGEGGGGGGGEVHFRSALSIYQMGTFDPNTQPYLLPPYTLRSKFFKPIFFESFSFSFLLGHICSSCIL